MLKQVGPAMSKFGNREALNMIYALLLSLTFVSLQAFGATEEEINAEALKKTQELLRDPTQRKKYGAESQKAAAQLNATDKLVGPNNTKETYDLTADIFGSMERKANGNPKDAVEAAQKSPEDFFNSLTPEQQARIHELARKIESERGPSSKQN
jgi:hypothetical protein